MTMPARRCRAFRARLLITAGVILLSGCSGEAQPALDPQPLPGPEQSGTPAIGPSATEDVEEDESSPSPISELSPGVTGELTDGTWRITPSAWLDSSSACSDLLVFEGTDEASEGRFLWVYWRSDNADPQEQVAVADYFGEFGWGSPGDANLMGPARISVATEWIEVIRYERWPTAASSSNPGELMTEPADGYAIIARTIEPAGFLGVGSIVLATSSSGGAHDPQRLIETLTFNLDELLEYCP
jgi:hypothetical protein